MWSLSTVNPCRIECRIIHDEKDVCWISASANFAEHPDGSIVATGYLCDITDVRRSEAAGDLDEVQLRTAVGAVGDGLWDWNPQSDEVFFSTGWKRMLGFEDHEIDNVLDEWSKRLHPDDIDQCLADLNDHFEGRRELYSNEHRVLCKDGSYKWVLDRGRVVSWNKDRKPVRVIGLHTDITKRKEKDETLRLQSQILEVSPVGIAMLDATRESYPVIYSNAAFTNITGYTADEVLGEPCRYATGASTEKGFAELQNAIVSGKSATITLQDERQNNGRFWNQIIVQPVTDGRGDIGNIILVLQDISAEVELTSVLESAKQDADEANRMKSLFLTRTSHEIRTPLNAIMGFSQLLTLSGSLDGEQKDNATGDF